MRTRVRCQNETLQVGELVYDLRKFHRVMVISIGKAAAPMADLLLPLLESALEAPARVAPTVSKSLPSQRR
jgi:glycerate-2-kinase